MAVGGEKTGEWCDCRHAEGQKCDHHHLDAPPIDTHLSTGSALSDNALVKHNQVPSGLPEFEDSSDKEAGEEDDGGTVKKVESQAEKMSKATIAAIMFSLCMALFLAALDITIITTALPTVAAHFKASGADYTWIGSSYIVACAGAVPVWGKVSDIFGRKPALLLANAIFCGGSLVSALSVSVNMLLAGRVIQGIGGGGLIILVNICISDLFSMRERGKYLGIVGATWAIASAIGPLLGGVFSERISWRWCCKYCNLRAIRINSQLTCPQVYINLPLDGTAFLLLIFFLKIETPKTPFVAGIKAIDWLGVVTIVGGVVMFLLGLEAGGVTHPWNSAYTLGLIIFGWLTIVLFFLIQWKISKYPLMPLRLFTQWTNIAALGVCFCHGAVFIGGAYYLPLYFQTVLSASPILSGVYLFPLVITLSIASAGVGILIKKVGRYQEPIWFGMAFMTLGFGLFINLPDHAVWSKLIIYEMIAGIGVGPNFQSPLIALQNHVAPHDVAVATGTFGFVRQLATSVSVVLGGVIFQNVLSKKGPELARQLGPQVAARLSGSRLEASTTFVKNLPPAQKLVIDQAITSSMRTMYIFYTVIGVFGLFLSLFISKKALSNVHEKSRTGLAEQERVRVEEKGNRQNRMAQMTTESARNADVEKNLTAIPANPDIRGGD
jgi:MFS family permease